MKYLKLIVSILIGIGAILLYQSGLLTVESITTLVEDSPTSAPLIFIGMYIVATVFFVPATPLSLSAGALFGAVSGAVYILIGASIGAGLAFLTSRFILQQWANQLVDTKLSKIREYFDAIERNGFLTVLFLRLVPLFPFNGINFALGITKVKFVEYMTASVLGIIPGVVTLSFLGGAFLSGNIRDIVIGLMMYLVLASVGVIYNQYKKKTV